MAFVFLEKGHDERISFILTWILTGLVFLIDSSGLCILQRNPVDRTFYLAKELLMTERTYKKDLEVIVVVGGCYLFECKLF